MLPYIVALDHDTKSVVVAIRGSVSSADWVTDMLGVPEPLGDWLPDSFRNVSRASDPINPEFPVYISLTLASCARLSTLSVPSSLSISLS